MLDLLKSEGGSKAGGSKPLQMRFDGKGGVRVEGLSEEVVVNGAPGSHFHFGFFNPGGGFQAPTLFSLFFHRRMPYACMMDLTADALYWLVVYASELPEHACYA